MGHRMTLLGIGILDPVSRAGGAIKATMMQSKHYAFLVEYTHLKDLLEVRR